MEMKDAVEIAESVCRQRDTLSSGCLPGDAAEGSSDTSRNAQSDIDPEQKRQAYACRSLLCQLGDGVPDEIALLPVSRSVIASGTTTATTTITARFLSAEVNAEATAISPRLTFLRLPGEIRGAIYDLVFSDARIYYEPTLPSGDWSTCSANLNLGLRSVCKLIRAETEAAFFKELVVKVGTRHTHMWRRDKMAPFVNCLPTKLTRKVLSHVQRLVITTITPTIFAADYLNLAQLPSLKSLTYRCLCRCPVGMFDEPDFRARKDSYVAEWKAAVIDRIRNATLFHPKYQRPWLQRILDANERHFPVIFELEAGTGSLQGRGFRQTELLDRLSWVFRMTIVDDGGTVRLVDDRWLTSKEYKRSFEHILHTSDAGCRSGDRIFNWHVHDSSIKARLKQIEHRESLS